MNTSKAAVLPWLLALALVPQARAQEPQPDEQAPVIQQVDVAGNQFLQRETLLYYVQAKPGERYDERRLREDFKRLWDTGFLDDLRIEALDGPKGKIVRFHVTERKRIQIVDYRGYKDLSTTTIEDELKKRDAQIKIDTFYDQAKARKVEAIIKEMLAAKGLPFATVRHEAKGIGGAGQQLSFIIEPGAKAKVQEIVFDGNTVFSDARLRGVMKNIKQPGFLNLSWLGGKRTYTEEKWVGGGEKDTKGDHGRLEDFYLNRGYVTARIGQPRVTYTDKPGKNPKKPVKHMRLEIPVVEGEQYRMGELKFDGLKVLKEEFVRSFFKLEPGQVYNDSKFKKAYEKLRDIYGTLGYFQWTGGTQRKPDPERKVVDITVKMDEDKQYFVGRIAFTGNDSTRDKVIRREIYMNEGEVFNTEALKMSIKRINQLGYFKQMEGAPDIKPSDGADNKVDVTFKVEEQNRNQFTFGGGVSGLEGTFLNASFSTSNFLGAGETFQIYAQTGRRTKNYSLSVSEPYFLDRPINAGVDLFKRKITYPALYTVTGYSEDRTGMSLVGGMLVGKWSRAFVNYTYEVVKIGEATIDPDDPYYQLYQYYGYGYGLGYGGGGFNPLLFGGTDRRRESRITPNLVYNTVDNPWTPRSGMRHTVTMTFAGGPLGGTVNYLRPSAEAIVYLPVGRKMSLGMRAEAAWIKPFGNGQVLPWYQRYFLGGETQVRGYEIREIGPLDSQRMTIGGNKLALFNAEYYFDVFGPLRALLFFDAGQAYFEGERMNLRNMRTSTGAEVRFLMPVLNVPFRLIYAINPTRSEFEKQLNPNTGKSIVPYSTFKFAVGTTF